MILAERKTNCGFNGNFVRIDEATHNTKLMSSIRAAEHPLHFVKRPANLR
jgi:hypothetical protein